MWRVFLAIMWSGVVCSRGPQKATPRPRGSDLSLWIDEHQVKLFSGMNMEIYCISDGKVMPFILDPNFEKYLPVIPSEVGYVNFTWKSGAKRYYYNFDRLQTFDEGVLEPPMISINTSGRVPKKPKAPDPECDKKCANGGWCNHEKLCQCPEGYMGQHCKTALCYPQCMNGGNCTAPGVCSCPPGFQGRHCEGGICSEKCLNGGKCVQKDTCECPKGYYGLRCEYSKCIVPCTNGGRCRGVNKCKCLPNFRGDHCERRISMAKSRCNRPCRHGVCRGETCHCHHGWAGRLCNQRIPPVVDDYDEDEDDEDEEEEETVRTRIHRKRIDV